MNIEHRTRVAIFASGTGSNFEAIMANQERTFDVIMLICDRPKAHVVGKAASYGVETVVLDPNTFSSKAEYEQEVVKHLIRANIEFIALAGYMRIIGQTLLSKFPNTIVNIHPSLLLAFPGKDAVAHALDAGVIVSGVTIHYIEEGVDSRPVIAQELVIILPIITM